MGVLTNQSVGPLVTFFCALLLSACAQNNTGSKVHTYVYTPQYLDFIYKVDGKIEVKHSFLFGPGVEKCRYVGEFDKPYMKDGYLLYPYKKDRIDNFYEVNGHIYQGGLNSDQKVLGFPRISRLGGEIDSETGEQKMYVTKLWRFDALCLSRVGSSEYGIYLQKSSALSIEEAIAQTERLLGGAWKPYARWQREGIVERGNNIWTVFKTWNRADYLSDAAEYWYLPLGDGSFYYKVYFSYKSAMRAENDDQYLLSREAFNHILDSFEVRKLTPEESAAIVNPEPIEPKKIDFNQDLKTLTKNLR